MRIWEQLSKMSDRLGEYMEIEQPTQRMSMQTTWVSLCMGFGCRRSNFRHIDSFSMLIPFDLRYFELVLAFAAVNRHA